jgi:glycosyltransferase involved in cell wall biosynthesis
MHVVQVNYAHDPAFPEPDALLERFVILVEWSEALLAAGAARVTVVQRFTRDLELRRNGVDYLFRADVGRSRPRPSPWAWPRRLHRAVATLAPDLVHVNGLIFPVQTWLLRRALPARTAIAVQDHSGKGIHVDPLMRAIQRAGLRVADGFLFTAAAQARPWREAGLIGPDQPVYQALEGSRPFRPLPREVARAASRLRGDPALLWVGRLDRNKDPLTVLEGFEEAARHLPGAHLTMIHAADELLPEVRARVARSPVLADRVHLLGRVPYEDMAAFYCAADLFVLGSHYEGTTLALIEAIASGAVPVVTDIPSCRALTADGALGALWSPGDAAALAKALVELGQAVREPLRKRMADYFERELARPAVGRRAMAIYEELCARRRTRRR